MDTYFHRLRFPLKALIAEARGVSDLFCPHSHLQSDLTRRRHDSLIKYSQSWKFVNLTRGQCAEADGHKRIDSGSQEILIPANSTSIFLQLWMCSSVVDPKFQQIIAVNKLKLWIDHVTYRRENVEKHFSWALLYCALQRKRTDLDSWTAFHQAITMDTSQIFH